MFLTLNTLLQNSEEIMKYIMEKVRNINTECLYSNTFSWISNHRVDFETSDGPNMISVLELTQIYSRCVVLCIHVTNILWNSGAQRQTTRHLVFYDEQIAIVPTWFIVNCSDIQFKSSNQRSSDQFGMPDLQDCTSVESNS